MAVIAEHLPRVGIGHVLVALYRPADADPVAQSIVLLSTGFAAHLTGRQFATRMFPPPGIYPEDTPVQLAVLPLVVHDRLVGFAAFEASNLEPCAAIVRNLASVIHSAVPAQTA